MPPNISGILAIYGSHDNERQYVCLLLLPGPRSREVHLFAGWVLGGSGASLEGCGKVHWFTIRGTSSVLLVSSIYFSFFLPCLSFVFHFYLITVLDFVSLQGAKFLLEKGFGENKGFG